MALRDLFQLDPAVAHLNHGGFGAVPRAVLDARLRVLAEIEADPTHFHTAQIGGRLAAALEPVATALGVERADLAWVANTTSGLALVARSLELRPGDEVVLTDLEYGSQRTLWTWVAERAGARVVDAHLDGRSGEEAVAAVADAVTERTRAALVSHITSATARRLPVAAISAAVRGCGAMVVVDGAHAPGHIEPDIAAIGCDVYVANLHKWWATPRSAAIIWATAEAQRRLDPLVVSWGGVDRSVPLAERINEPGTTDVSGLLAVPDGLAFHAEHLAPARAGARALLEEAVVALAERGYSRTGDRTDDLLMSAFELPAGVDPGRLEVELGRRGVRAYVSAQSHRRLLRIAVAWYSTSGDIDRLIATCDALASS